MEEINSRETHHFVHAGMSSECQPHNHPHTRGTRQESIGFKNDDGRDPNRTEALRTDDTSEAHAKDDQQHHPSALKAAMEARMAQDAAEQQKSSLS